MNFDEITQSRKDFENNIGIECILLESNALNHRLLMFMWSLLLFKHFNHLLYMHCYGIFRYYEK